VERYSPLYGQRLSDEVQMLLTSSQKEFTDVCHRVRFLRDYYVEIAGFLTCEYFDVVR
jgi:hypothetical protein